MTKHYCDRCGVECDKLNSVRVTVKNLGNGSNLTETMEVCPACEKEHKRLEDMLIDFKITVYSKFFKLKDDKPIKKSGENCGQICQYNSIYGCNLEEKGGICPMSNSVKWEG